MALGLLDDAVARVDQDHHRFRRGHARDGVAGVLLVAGAIGEDEGTGVGGEVAVRHVDGDALLPLGAQAVDQQRQVGALLAAGGGGGGDGLVLVGENVLGVVQQPADERGLSVVDGAGGAEAQCGGHQK